MRWMRWMHAGRPACGQVDGDAVRVHEGGSPLAPGHATGERVALADITTWLPPVQPAQVIGLWNNFRAAAQKNGLGEPPEPLYFLKSPHCVTAHGSTIPAAPDDVGRVVYEGELAIVIGQPAYRIAREKAAAHILGYTAANDVTAPELLRRDASFQQWVRAKSMPGFGALGPWLDTAFAPQGAGLRTLVGGRERQNYAFDDMFFGPEELVFRLAQDLLLAPGDVILCGTSLGAMPMRAGTVVEVVVDGLGTLRNTYG